MDLTQIDELLSVANVELAADRLRDFSTVEIIDHGGFAVALYVLYGRYEEIAEQFRGSTARFGDLKVSFTCGDVYSFYQAEADFIRLGVVSHRVVGK